MTEEKKMIQERLQAGIAETEAKWKNWSENLGKQHQKMTQDY